MEARDGGEILLAARKDDAKKVSGKPIDEIQCGVANDEERDSTEAENLDRHPAGAGVSQSERDGAWWLDALRRGLDPAIVRACLEERRADDEPNPGYYAQRTLEGAVASLRGGDASPGEQTLMAGEELGRAEGKQWLSII